MFLTYINDLHCLEFRRTRVFSDDTNSTACGKSINEVEEALNFELWNVKE